MRRLHLLGDMKEEIRSVLGTRCGLCQAMFFFFLSPVLSVFSGHSWKPTGLDPSSSSMRFTPQELPLTRQVFVLLAYDLNS